MLLHCVCMHVHACGTHVHLQARVHTGTWHSKGMMVRAQHARVDFPPPRRFQGLNTGHPAWQQTPLSNEPWKTTCNIKKKILS